jgi:hypothetical protein
LFYVLTILAYFTRHAGILFVVLAWIFVIFRYLQAYVHVTNNQLLCGLNAQYLKYISQAAVAEVPYRVPSRGCQTGGLLMARQGGLNSGRRYASLMRALLLGLLNLFFKPFDEVFQLV